MKNTDPLVTILLATFNGAAYLKEQLDSLIRQTYVSWELVVHDDGSTDGTLDILAEYSEMEPRMMLLDDGVTGLGAVGNFIHLLNHVRGDLYMFCDQDDIWLENKVASMVNVIKGHHGPALVYANAHFYKGGTVVKQNTTVMHPSSLRNTLFLNSGVQGCSTLVNAALVELLRPFPETLAMHDHLFTMGAVSFGRIIYVDRVLMWYRQHDQNVTGGQHVGWASRLKSFFSRGKPVISRPHFIANEAFYRHYFEKFNPDDHRLFKKYFQYGYCKSRIKRIFIVLKHGFSLGDKKGVLFLKTLLRKPIN